MLHGINVRMQLRPEWLVLYGAVALLYLIVAWREWRWLHSETHRALLWPGVILGLALAMHGVLLAQDLLADGHLRFGFAQALSATLWLTAVIVWIESYFSATRGLFLLVLPLTAVAAILPAIFPGAILGRVTDSAAFRVHVVLAILSYSLLTIAALQALLMASMDRRLHGDFEASRGPLTSLLERLPPLLAMETVLFRLIAVGFVLLTATLASGIFFSEQLFGRPLRFDHKTVFTLAAWLIFGGLLVGRVAFGWRGRTALRWTLTGFAMLLLAYIGTRFVIEVLLGRT
ncbi:MAG: cytochrome C assembly family protein [Burkholderiaceae bacterium]